MRRRAADGEHDEPLVPAIHELAPDGGRDTSGVVGAQLALLALDDQGQGALEHEVDLLLVLVGVDAPALTRQEDHDVDPERRHPQLPAQRLEALRAVAVDRVEGHIELVHRRSLER